MTGLEVRAFRNEDNPVSMVIVVPPRRCGEPNFGAMARINRELLMVEPASFDPDALVASYEEQAVQHHAAEAPMPAHVAELLDRAQADDPHVGALKAEEAFGGECR